MKTSVMAKVILVEAGKKPSLITGGPGSDSGLVSSTLPPVTFGYRALAAMAIIEPQKFKTNRLEITKPLISLAKF